MTQTGTTADSFEELFNLSVRLNTAERLAAEQETIGFFAGMQEAARRKFSPEVMRLHKLAASQLGDVSSDRRVDAVLTSIAVAATATISELRKLSWWYPSAVFCRVLIDRRPNWLADGIELVLERATSSHAVGEIAQQLNIFVAQGMIEPPQHDRYALGIAFAYAFDPKLPQRVDRLRSDISRLAPAIWRQFEVEGGGEISLANFDKFFSGTDVTWGEALKALADEGYLERQRLLDASLDALNRGFSQYRAGWYSRFHELLEPTLDERARCTGRYLDLLASPIGPTVTLAVSALNTIDKTGRLGAEEIVARIAPALHAKAAATVKSALKLLAKAAKTEPRLRSAILRLAAIGLEHPSTEIQVQTVDLIEHHADVLDKAIRAAIDERLQMVNSPLQPRIRALLGAAPEMRLPEPDNDAEKLKKWARDLPAEIRRLVGVDAALAALEGRSADIRRAPFDGMDIPRLDPLKRVKRIATFEDLANVALVALEHPDDLDSIEAILASALRFAADPPADALELLAPVARSLKRYHTTHISDLVTPRGSLLVVLSALLGQESGEIVISEDDPRAVLLLRSMAMAAAIRDRRCCLQLSEPTHAGHWIDPTALVERSLAQRRDGSLANLGLSDQILALLRLAPDGRARALKAAGNLEDEWGAALRYALGGDQEMGTTKALWVAAARSRAPFSTDARLAALMGYSAVGLDLAPSFSYTTLERQGGWLQIGLISDPDTKPISFGKDGYTFLPQRSNKPATAEKCFPTRALSDLATLGLLDTYVPGDGRHRANWGALPIWPQNPEPLFALSVLSACMVDGNNYVKPANEPLAEGLKHILDPDVPAGSMALLMLCRGLNAIDKGAGQATVDALIAMIDDGRVDGSELGAAMHTFRMSGLVVARRWPDRLKDVARSSTLGLCVMTAALERALYPGTPKHPLRDMHAWLETLLEFSVKLGRSIENAEARAGIGQFLGSGKAGKAAKALLALKASINSEECMSAAQHALRNRIARAKRWLLALEGGSPE